LLSIYFLCVLGVRAYRRERIVDTIELGSQILVAPPGFAKLSENQHKLDKLRRPLGCRIAAMFGRSSCHLNQSGRDWMLMAASVLQGGP
jgi:hypothetical protein